MRSSSVTPVNNTGNYLWPKLRDKCPNTEIFPYFLFFIFPISPYSVRTPENTDQKNLRFWHFSHNAITIFFWYYNAITAFQLQKIMNRLHSQLQTKSTGSYKIVYITWVFHVFSLSLALTHSFPVHTFSASLRFSDVFRG